jgi:hypothetical protein
MSASARDLIASELFQDKSLLAVYWQSSSYAQNTFDKWVKIITVVVLVGLSAYLGYSKTDLFPIAVKSIASWLALGFNYSITILGFLVAGFTIFATMTKVEIFIALTRATHREQNVSHIKFIFYSFLRVFINHIMLLFACVGTTMLKDSSLIYLGLLADGDAVIRIKKIAVAVMLPIIGYLLVNAMLQLKTFVWNLYQSVIIAIAGAITLHETAEKK